METKIILFIAIDQILSLIVGYGCGYYTFQKDKFMSNIVFSSIVFLVLNLTLDYSTKDYYHFIMSVGMFLTCLLSGNLTYAKLKKDLTDKEKLQVSRGRIFALIAASIAISGIYYSIKVL